MGFTLLSCTDIVFDPILGKLRASDSSGITADDLIHNNLDGLQGGEPGTIGEYYHFNEGDYNLVSDVSINSSENQIIYNNGTKLVGDDALTFDGNILCVDGTVKVSYYTGTPQEGMIRYNPNDTMTCFEGYCNGQWIDLAGVRDTTIEHNMLSGIQGGQVGEYYHLTFDQWNTLVNSLNADSLHFHDSSNIVFDGGSLTTLSAINVEDALIELENRINNISIEIPVDEHNELTGIQGGDGSATIPEHYHLTFDQWDTLVNNNNADDLHFHDSANVTFDGGSACDLESDNLEDIVLELCNRINNIEVNAEIECCMRKRCLAGC